MAAEVIQPAESLPTRLAGVRPLSRVAAQVTFQVGFSLHHVAAEGALESHPGQVICQKKKKKNQRCHVVF